MLWAPLSQLPDGLKLTRNLASTPSRLAKDAAARGNYRTTQKLVERVGRARMTFKS